MAELQRLEPGTTPVRRRSAGMADTLAVRVQA